ncbi:glycosyltransferase [Almyronema epifaneia]|uniref:Glycosyltransferase n=1 Tax=Almyronema epifaneia S1 TaxID=2991925 RepID=A0ABW6IL73_9CYAN
MTSPSIFYFVNAEGSGHTRRAEAILPFLDMPVVLASENPALFKQADSPHSLYPLPSLRSTGDRQLADDVLHLPYGRDRAYLPRVQAIVDLCQQHRCALAVIDVCAETAMIMRLCGIPYLYMRMSGKRDDAAHLQSYRAAVGLIASYPQAFEENWVPDWIRQKTCYVGGIASSKLIQVQEKPITPKPYVLVMRGKGTSQITLAAIASAAAFIPDYYWMGIGFEQAHTGQNFAVLPYVSDPIAYLQSAAIAIANTGNNSVLEVGFQAKPFITLPEWRFFDEQMAKAAMLAQHHLAVVLREWPQTGEAWQSVLAQTASLRPQRWPEILSSDGAQQAAAYITNQFEQFSPPSPYAAQSTAKG